jgi:hypothetical protein
MTPKKDIFFELRCAFNTSEFVNKSFINHGEERVVQFIEGFKSFFKLAEKYLENYEDVYVVDNTITDKSEIDKRILEVIPKDVNFILINKNQYGKLNKGAGDIEAWIANEKIISKYKYIFHHEPRQILLNFNLYKSFLEHQTNTFCQNEPTKINKQQFWTGTWIMDTKLLKKYTKHTTPEKMVNNSISIEFDLFEFFKNKEYTKLEEAGVLWHDQGGKKDWFC